MLVQTGVFTEKNAKNNNHTSPLHKPRFCYAINDYALHIFRTFCHRIGFYTNLDLHINNQTKSDIISDKNCNVRNSLASKFGNRALCFDGFSFFV